MTTSSSLNRQDGTPSQQRSWFRPQLATLVMVGVVVLSGVIVAAWFAGQGTISRIFYQLNELQEHPPLWLQVPMVAGAYLLVPTVMLFLIVLVVMKVSPRPRTWSRFVVVGILLALTARYLLWRSFSTLNLDTPLDGVFSLGLLIMELVTLLSSSLQLALVLCTRDRRREADWLAMDVLEGRYMPTVDILVPTYDEPEFILRRTIIGCQAIEYPYKTVYLLDDTHRPEIKKLAEQLGCEYVTRPDNRHAKAGNLNHAIAQTNGELIVVFDADFVPTKNFLIRTVGFFQDPQIALVQTPQSFYNADPIARNLGLENDLTPEDEVFYRHIQPIRDGAGSVICSGTSFLVRRSALEETGGFFTDSLSEDYFTGIRLSARGYRLIYLDEKLSAGLAAENIPAHATQRLRWARGTLQAFFIKTNPLTIPGLNLLQRLAHLEGLMHWFSSIPQVVFLLMPLAYSFLGVIPLRATPAELMYFFLPYYLVQLAAFSWLNGRSRSALLSAVYSLVLVFPLALTVIRVMLNPFSKGFNVTPKGTASDRYSFNWSLAWPLLIMFVATAVSLWVNFGNCMIKGSWTETVTPEVATQIKGIGLGWIWSSYNLLMIGAALLILLDVPRPTPYEWFALRRTVRLKVKTKMGEKHFWGVTTLISELGTEVALTQLGFPWLEPDETLPLTLEIQENDLVLRGEATQTSFDGDFPTVRILFEQIDLQQQRQLIELLFCRPGQWKNRYTPNEFQALWLLFRALIRPRVLFDRTVEANAVPVAQV